MQQAIPMAYKCNWRGQASHLNIHHDEIWTRTKDLNAKNVIKFSGANDGKWMILMDCVIEWLTDLKHNPTVDRTNVQTFANYDQLSAIALMAMNGVSTEMAITVAFSWQN